MYLFRYLFLIVYDILTVNASNLLIISVYKMLFFIDSVATVYIHTSCIGFSLIFSDLTSKNRKYFLSRVGPRSTTQKIVKKILLSATPPVPVRVLVSPRTLAST